MTAEISFDLKMEDEMSFVEGVYRLPGSEWQVFAFTRRAIDAPEIQCDAKWESGVTGTVVRYPRSSRLNRAVVLRILSECLAVSEWREVQGPDSIKLR
jgi:hypothetical protein